MKILCPTDFSDRARAAAQIAVDLAQRTAGSVELLHVAPPRTTERVAAVDDTGARDDREDKIRSEAQAKLAAQCRELSASGAALSAWLADGELEASILSRASAIGADLIVMGAHEKSALARFVLGSAAEWTVRRADRPVLIVPPGAAMPLRPTNGKGHLRLLVALDGRAASRGALEFVRSLRAQFSCDVTFLRLYWPPDEYERLGLTGAHDLAKPEPEIVADLGRDLRMQIGVLPGKGETSVTVEPAWGDPSGAILDFAIGKQFDLVVMGAESRHGLGRITHSPVANRVAHHAAGVPVVFVPAPVTARNPTELPGIFTVLAPTDLSATGNRAVAFAYALLAHHGGVVELCHVHERALPTPAYVYDSPDGKLGDADRAGLLAQLRALVPPDAQRLGITTHITVIDGGKAAQAIVQGAERLAVDAIVLASHGRGAAHRALMGSVSESVVRHTHRPVLVVPMPKATS